MNKKEKERIANEYIDFCVKVRDIVVNGREEKVMLECGIYSISGSLSLNMFYAPTEKDWQECPPPGDQILKTLGIATVNLPESALLPPDVQFVDSRSFPEIGEFLEKECIAAPTGITVESGGHMYRAYSFILPELTMLTLEDARNKLARMVEDSKQHRQKAQVTFKR